MIHDPSRVGPLYQQLLSATQEELLVFNRPPYAKPVGQTEPLLLDAARRADTRVLYQAARAEDRTVWREEMERYHQAGVQARVVDLLPVKLAIFDRRCSLLTLDHPAVANVGFPVTLLVEHPGYSSVQAGAFEHLWATAAPYQQVHARHAKACCAQNGT